jgi:copper chaperone
MSTPQTHQIVVSGMSCAHCVKAVTQAVQALDPEARVQVDLPSGQVTVDTVLDRAQVRAAITEEGYEPQP